MVTAMHLKLDLVPTQRLPVSLPLVPVNQKCWGALTGQHLKGDEATSHSWNPMTRVSHANAPCKAWFYRKGYDTGEEMRKNNLV